MTQSMTRWMLAGCLVLATLGAVGTAAHADQPENPFAGSWSGTWSMPVIGHYGTFDWTISDAGRISGTVAGANGIASGTIVGHVGAGGDLMFVGFAPNDVPAGLRPPGGGPDGIPFQGTAVIGEDGKLYVSALQPFEGSGIGGGPLVATLERN